MMRNATAATDALGPAIEQMADTLASEIRLMRELGALLQKQREGVAADELSVLEQAVFATHRVLMTLGEARRRRRALEELFDRHAERPAEGPLRAAYDELRHAAYALAAEVEISREVIEAALRASDEQIRALYGRAGQAGLYDNRAAPAPPLPGEGALFSQKA